MILTTVNKTIQPTGCVKSLLNAFKWSSVTRNFGIETDLIGSCFNLDLETLRKDPYDMNYSILNFDDFDSETALLDGFVDKLGRDGQLNVYNLETEASQDKKVRNHQELVHKILIYSKIYRGLDDPYKKIKSLAMSTPYCELLKIGNLLPMSLIRSSQLVIRLEDILNDETILHSDIAKLKNLDQFEELIARKVICEMNQDFLVHDRNLRPLLTGFIPRNSSGNELQSSENIHDLWIVFDVTDKKKVSYDTSLQHGMAQVLTNGQIYYDNWIKEQEKGKQSKKQSNRDSNSPSLVRELLFDNQSSGDAFIMDGIWTGPLADQEYCKKLSEFATEHDLESIKSLF